MQTGKNNSHPMKRVYLSLFSITSLMITCLLAYILWASYQTAIHETRLSTRNLSITLESHLQGVLSRSEAMLEAQANDLQEEIIHRPSEPGSRENISKRMSRLLLQFPEISGSYIFDTGGDMLYTSDATAKPSNVADRPFFKAAQSDSGSHLFFSEALIARTTGRWSIVIAHGIRDAKGRFIGVTTALFDLEQEEKLLATLVKGKSGAALIRRSDTSRLMLRTPFNPVEINKPLPLDNPVRKLVEAGMPSGTLNYFSAIDQVERLVSFRKLARYPFYVQVGLAKNDYLSNWYRQLYWSIAIEAIFLTLMVYLLQRLLRSESQQAEVLERLIKSEARYNSLFTGAMSPMLLISPQNGRIVEANRAAYRYYGYPEGRLEELFINDLNTLTAEQIAAEMQLAEQEKRSHFFFRHKLSSGEIKDVEVHSGPIEIDDQHLLYSIIHDITERKKSEIELNRLLQIITDAPDYIATADMQGQLKFLNKAGARIVGLSNTCDPSNLKISDMHPELATKRVFEEGIPTVLKQGFWQAENTLQHRDGHQIAVSQLLMLHRDETGKPYLLSTIMRDITGMKQAETELLRSNAELEQFSYSISHDMRQPLRMISSYLQLLELSLADKLDPEKKKYLNFAVEGAKRIDHMLMDLLEYSRIGRMSEPPCLVESRVMLDEALLFLQPLIAEACAKVMIRGEWPKIYANRNELTRLLQNLIGNAAKYRVAGRIPEITLSSLHLCNVWHLSIIDNGVGIIPEQIVRLFKVFQRLHSRDTYEGTGIGLALCRKIVEHHKGRIWVESKGDGLGCQFYVELPTNET